MSYGDRPDKWSTCSNSDFKTWYLNYGFDCLPTTESKICRRGFEGVLLGVCSSVDVTQSEGDLPDFNQSEH